MARSQIGATITTGITLTSAAYSNPVTITTTASIIGSSRGAAVSAAATWTIDNCGQIYSARNAGIALSAGGMVSNASSGTINAYSGVSIGGASGTVVNAGVI